VECDVEFLWSNDRELPGKTFAKCDEMLLNPVQMSNQLIINRLNYSVVSINPARFRKLHIGF